MVAFYPSFLSLMRFHLFLKFTYFLFMIRIFVSLFIFSNYYFIQIFQFF